jgi:hypothetical protein
MPDDRDRSVFRQQQVEAAREKLKQGVTPDDLIRDLHADRLSIVECIWIVSTATGLPLETAKNLVVAHSVWSQPANPGATGGTP